MLASFASPATCGAEAAQPMAALRERPDARAGALLSEPGMHAGLTALAADRTGVQAVARAFQWML